MECTFVYVWGTFCDDCTSRLSHLSRLSSHLPVIIGENLLSSFFIFTFKPKILQSFTCSQLTTCFRHNSQKTSMPSCFSTHTRILIIYMLTLEIFFQPAKRKKEEKEHQKFYLGVSRLDINAIPTQMNLALHSLDPLCSTDNSQKSIFFDSLPPGFTILYMFGK